MGQVYSLDRQLFSTAAHNAALDSIYPRLFPGCDYSVESVVHQDGDGDLRNQALDCHLGVDYVAHLNSAVPSLRLPTIITIQERFREPKYAHYQDLTITEWNPRTNQPGEIHKLAAQLFVYGYYSQQENQFSDAICINTAKLLVALNKRQIVARRNQGTNSEQPFLSFSFQDLHRIKSVEWHMAKSEPFAISDMLQSLHARIDLQEPRLQRIEYALMELIKQQPIKKNRTNVVHINQELPLSFGEAKKMNKPRRPDKA